MASGYKFSLEKLLEVREEKEEASKRLFSDSQNKVVKTESELTKLKDNYESYKGIKPNEDVVYQKIKRNYLYALQAGIKTKEKQLVKHKRELEVRRNDLKQRQIERKTVSILKEKQYNSYMKEQARIEQVNLDEFALYAYMRNAKGGE